MIDQITLKNFKAFKELNQFDIKPITVLCGTNSCGKSSILQSILLLKQTLESQNVNQTLLLNGRFVHLGSFENILHQKNIAKDLEIDVTFRIRPNEEYSGTRKGLPWYVILRDILPRDRGSREIFFKYSIKLSIDKTKNQFLQNINVNSMKISISNVSEGDAVNSSIINLQKQTNNQYLISWSNLRERLPNNPRQENSNGSGETEVDFINLFPVLAVQQTSERHLFNVHYAMHRFRDLVKNIFSSYTYLGPLREEPSRRYIYEDEVIEIGSKGENAAHIYLNEQTNLIPLLYTYDVKKNSFQKQENVKLADGVRNWLNLMGIRNLEPEPQNEIIYLNLESNSSMDTRVNIADVGFGVSQIFPIILEGLRMPKRSTLLLEQPEIHLHPNLQMQMADYFLALAMSDKKVIVETHSDHIINRLVRRIVEDSSGKIKDLINIYFIKSTTHGSECEQIQIDESRGIINWPTDFFDQTASEQERTLQAGLQKRKNQRTQKGR